MAENIRALIALLVLAIPTLWLLRPQLTAFAIAPADYKLRAGLWIALTTVLFLANNFWLYVLVVALTVLTVGRKDSNPLGLYFFLVLLAPPFRSDISGFGVVNYLFAMDHLRLLSVVILLPLAMRLWRDPASPRLFKFPADKYIVAYLALQLAIQAPVTTATDTMRWLVTHFIDVYLPYYAFSRGLSSGAKLRDTLASFVAACGVAAVVALFETGKHWLLYSSLPSFLGVSWAFGGYMERDGALRAIASTGHSIVLGYVLMVALGFHLSLRFAFPSRRAWTIVFVLLCAGIVSSYSRGPWVGAAVVLLVAMAMSPRAGAKFVKLAVASMVALPLLMLTPYGAKLFALLPFVGNVDTASVDYRQEVFTVSWGIIMMNPWFGSPYYMAGLEQLRQGEGIVDIVNSYIGIALYSGFVGLGLFVLVFATSLRWLFMHVFRHTDRESESFSSGLALLATLVGVLVAIATLSSINAVPVMYWCLAGTCSAFLYLTQAERDESLQPAPFRSMPSGARVRRASAP